MLANLISYAVADFFLKNLPATKNQTFFVLIFPEKSFFRKKVSSRLLFLFKILYVYISIILKIINGGQK